MNSVDSLAPAPAPTLCLHGQAVVRGYTLGHAVVMSAASLEVAHYHVSPDDIEAERQRLRQAIETAVSDLRQMANTLPMDAPRELAALLSVHGLLLEDPLLVQSACELISERHYNAEWALAT